MNKAKISKESPSLQAHLQILQTVVNRMASNCASCKNWCVTLVSALLVLMADKSSSINESVFSYISFLPIVLFSFLDSYYLGLEKGFRDKYNEILKNVDEETLYLVDLFSISPSGDSVVNFFEGIRSPSVWPFYSLLGFVAYLITFVLKS